MIFEGICEISEFFDKVMTKKEHEESLDNSMEIDNENT